MVEFDLIDRDGKAELHRLFVRFPGQDFGAKHAKTAAPASAPSGPKLKLRYLDATVAEGRSSGIHLLLDAENKLYARFIDGDGSTRSTELKLTHPVKTPWENRQLIAMEIYPRARNERALKAKPPGTGKAVPAAFVRLYTDKQAHRLWLRQGESYTVHIGGKRFQVSYVPPRIPMGFTVKLIEPIITHYPGTDRPRTYQSRVLVEEPHGGAKLEQTISMNAPLKHGGFSFYQSSYQFGQDNKPAATILSVVSDRGEAVVYVGYITLIHGLVFALVQRVRRKSKSKSKPKPAASSA
jgi:hypothetical protein